jgi:hypothetical protein
VNKPRITRYWTDGGRDFNGRLSGDVYIRIEWIDASGITRTSCGQYFADDHDINWQYDQPSHSVHAAACECALDSGEYATTEGATFAGNESYHDMSDACETTCASCGVRQPTLNDLSDDGECGRCFIARQAVA